MTGPGKHNSGPLADDGDIPAEVRETYDRLKSQDLDGPPELIDQAVLNRARTAVESPHSSRPWSFGWPHALSTAAVIALSLTVLLQLREETPPAMSPERSAPRVNVVPDTGPGAPAVAGATSEADAGADHEVLADDVSGNTAPMLMEALEEAPANRMLQKAGSRQEATPGSSGSPAAGARETLEDDPQAWLLEIRRLQEAGLVEQASEELALFRQRWPDISVPEDLE